MYLKSPLHFTISMNLLTIFSICMGLLSLTCYGATYSLKGNSIPQDNKTLDFHTIDFDSTSIPHHKDEKYLKTHPVDGTVAEITSTMNNTLTKSYNNVIGDFALVNEELKVKMRELQKREDACNQKEREIEAQRIAFRKETELKEKIVNDKTMEIKNEADRLKKLESEIRNKMDQLSQKESRISETETDVKNREEKVKLKEEELKRREAGIIQKEKRNNDAEKELKNKEGSLKTQEEELKRRENENIQKEKRNNDVETELKNKEARVKTREEELKRREDEVQKQKSEVEKQKEFAMQKEKHNNDVEKELKNQEARVKTKEEELKQREIEVQKQKSEAENLKQWATQKENQNTATIRDLNNKLALKNDELNSVKWTNEMMLQKKKRNIATAVAELQTSIQNEKQNILQPLTTTCILPGTRACDDSLIEATSHFQNSYDRLITKANKLISSV